MLRHTVLPSTIEASKVLYPRAHLEQAALNMVRASSQSKTILHGSSKSGVVVGQYDSHFDRHDMMCMRPSRAGRIQAHLTSSSDLLQNELLELGDEVKLHRYRKLTAKGAEPLVVCGGDLEPVYFRKSEACDLKETAKEKPFIHFVLTRQDAPLSQVVALVSSVLQDSIGINAASTTVDSIAVNFVPESYAGGVTQRMSVAVGAGGVEVDTIIQAVMNGVNALPYPIKIVFLGLSRSPCSIPLRGPPVSQQRSDSSHEDNARWHPLTNTSRGLYGACTSSTRVMHTLRLRGLTGSASELKAKLLRSLSTPFLNTFSPSLYSTSDLSTPTLAYLGDMVACGNYGGALYCLAKEHLSHLSDSDMNNNSLRVAYAQYKHTLGGGPNFQEDAVQALRSGCGSSSLLQYLPELAAASPPTSVEVELLSAFIEDSSLLLTSSQTTDSRRSRGRHQPDHQGGRGGHRRGGQDDEDHFEMDRDARLTTLNNRFKKIYSECIPSHSPTSASLLQARLFLAWNIQASGILTSMRADNTNAGLDESTLTPGLPRWLGSHHALQRIPQLHPFALGPILPTTVTNHQMAPIHHPTLTPSHTRKIDVVDNAGTFGTALLPIGQIPDTCRGSVDAAHFSNMGLAAGRFVAGDLQFRCWRPLLMRSDSVDARVGVMGEGGIAQDTTLDRHSLRRSTASSGSNSHHHDVRYVPSLIGERMQVGGGRLYTREKGIQSAVVSVVLPTGSSLGALLREGFHIKSDVPVLSEGPFSKTALRSVTGEVNRRSGHQHESTLSSGTMGRISAPIDSDDDTKMSLSMDKDDVMLTGNLLKMKSNGFKSERTRKRFDEENQ